MNNESKNPKISVIVPVYNAEKYLEKAVNSLTNQTFKNLEIILIDDGSKDASPKICDSLMSKDERIKVIHGENKGASHARNKGVEIAKGEYIAFVDADDTVNKEYISFMYSKIIEHHAMVCIVGYNKIYKEKFDNNNFDKENFDEEKLNKEKLNKENLGTESIIDKKSSNDKVMTGQEAMEGLLYQRGYMSVPWGSLSHKSLWKEVSFPEGIRAEDVATIYKIYALAERVVFNEIPLYNYYQRKTSTIFTTYLNKNIDYFHNSQGIIKYVSKNYPKSLLSAYSRHFSTCFQILSETKKTNESKELIEHIYKDIKKIRKKVLHDKNARAINRMAAMISMISIRLLHMLLRVYYKIKIKRL